MVGASLGSFGGRRCTTLTISLLYLPYVCTTSLCRDDEACLGYTCRHPPQTIATLHLAGYISYPNILLSR